MTQNINYETKESENKIKILKELTWEQQHSRGRQGKAKSKKVVSLPQAHGLEILQWIK